MRRRPPRSTLDRSSAASDVYKRQGHAFDGGDRASIGLDGQHGTTLDGLTVEMNGAGAARRGVAPVSYTHLRAHETVLDLVCRLLLEKKNPEPPRPNKITHATDRRKNNTALHITKYQET